MAPKRSHSRHQKINREGHQDNLPRVDRSLPRFRPQGIWRNCIRKGSKIIQLIFNLYISPSLQRPHFLDICVFVLSSVVELLDATQNKSIQLKHLRTIYKSSMVFNWANWIIRCFSSVPWTTTGTGRMAGGPFFLWHDSGSRCLRLRALLHVWKILLSEEMEHPFFALEIQGLDSEVSQNHWDFFWIFAIDLKQCISRISTPQNVSYWTFPCYFFQNRNTSTCAQEPGKCRLSLLWRCSAAMELTYSKPLVTFRTGTLQAEYKITVNLLECISAIWCYLMVQKNGCKTQQYLLKHEPALVETFHFM